MTFATPIWLAAAASVVVPILIHLFGRPRPRLRRFPSLMLLRRAQSERRSTARLRRIVSLLLRCFALLLLAIVLSGPLSEWPPLARLGERLGATAIVLDTSPSMGATTDGGRAIDRARDAGQAIVAALPTGEEIIMLADDGAARVHNAEEATAAIRASSTDGRRARLGDEVASLLDSDRRLSRIFLLTDLQATSLDALPPVMSLQTRAFVIDAGEEIAGNSALIDLQSETPVHLRGRPMSLVATAHTWGEGPGRVPMTVACDGDELAAGIDLLPDASASATVEVAPADAGVLTCIASLPADALHADDTRVFAGLVRERLRVAIIGGDARTRFIRAALDPYAPGDARSTVELLGADALHEEVPLDVAIVAAGEISEDDLTALRALEQHGTGVLLCADVGGAALDSLGFAGVSVSDAQRTEEPLALAELSMKRAPLAPFAEPGAGDLSAARFLRVPEVSMTEGATAAVLARFSDGTPALLEGAVGRGWALLFATSPDDAWTDLVQMPEFVPLMHRLTLHLAAGTAPSVLAGSPGDVTVGVALPGAEQMRVVNADGEEMPLQVADGRWSLVAPEVGAYRVRSAEEDIAAFAVNLDSAESDPQRLFDEQVRERLRPLSAEVVRADALPSLLDRLGPGSADVSSLVALLALIVLAIESVQSLGAARGSSDGEQ